MPLPLDGIRVADFCWLGAGAYTTKMLADMGADVIKIESSTHIDSLRITAPFADKIPGVNRSGYFADRNSSKRSITINVKKPEGREVIAALIAVSDVVSNNFAPGAMERMGFSYDAVRKIKDDIIYLSMSYQGATGPDRATLGYGLTIGALSGLHYLTGLPEREPSGTGTHYPDHIPNPCHAAFSVMAALRHRRRTGQGQEIDLSQMESSTALVAPAIMAADANGDRVEAVGNRAPSAAPRGVYPCEGEDCFISIAIESNAQWEALVDLLGLPIRSDWATLRGRVADHDAIDALVADKTAKLDRYALMADLQAIGVCCGVVQTAADVVERDPQLRHREHWIELPHKEVGSMIYNALPFRFVSQRLGPRFGAPLLGEHNEAVLHDLLGKSREEIEALAAKGVLE